jgi:hypothetical protein
MKWILPALLPLAGCAGTDIQPVAYNGPGATDDTRAGIADDDARGFRYYEGAHFLLVYSDGKSGLKAEVKFLPDVTRIRSVDPYAYFAKNESTLTFQNGMLVQSKTVVDETALPTAAVNALKTVAQAAIAAANAAAGRERTYLPFPKLYKIDIDAEGRLALLEGEVRVAGDKPEPGVWVLPPEPAK